MPKSQALRNKKGTDPDRKPDPDKRPSTLSPEVTNEVHPGTPGQLTSLPGAGVVASDADLSTREGGPGHDVPGARVAAPGAQRAGTTEGRAAAAARGARGGLGEIEAPSSQGQTAYSPTTGGTGAPRPGSSGIRATSDPNFTAQRADEEGTPSKEALAEQAARRPRKRKRN